MWHGDATKPDSVSSTNLGAHAVVRIVKPGDAHQSVTFVNRVLPFVFADDESFGDLMKLPKDAFRMSCGNQLCVNMAHISFQDDNSSVRSGNDVTTDGKVLPAPVEEAEANSNKEEALKESSAAPEVEVEGSSAAEAAAGGGGGNTAASPERGDVTMEAQS